jgi:hypothetical protein
MLHVMVYVTERQQQQHLAEVLLIHIPGIADVQLLHAPDYVQELIRFLLPITKDARQLAV